MALDILVVDDEEDIRNLVSGILEDEGYISRTASSCIEALDSIALRQPNLVILDVWLGDGDRDGLRLLDVIQRDHRYVPVIMMSGHGTIETAVSAIKRGAYDFIEKPFDSARLLLSVSKAIEITNLKMENDRLKLKSKSLSCLVGPSSSTLLLKSSIQKIAALNGRCFISGPMGSDKEWIVSEIHQLSARRNGPVICINCQNQSTSRFEVDLFGMTINNSEKVTTKVGLLEKANGGSIYFDEIHCLSKDIQQKLCKILTEGVFARLGGSTKISANIRFFAGSSVDMDALVKQGLFSSVLYYRLAANVIKLTPLRERTEDIPFLLENFMNQAAMAYNVTPKTFSKQALAVLEAYPWPGDVNQLRNIVDWVLIMNSASEKSNIIDVQDLPTEITEGKDFSSGFAGFMSSFSALSIKEAREAFEKEYLTTQLKRFAGNVSQTSKFVGMERSALHRKIRYLNISDPKMNFE